MFMTLIAAALAAAAPAPTGQAADPHADHAKHGMTGAMHGEMCKDCKPGEGAAKDEHKSAEGMTMECCKDKAGADKAKCCAGHHAENHGDHKK